MTKLRVAAENVAPMRIVQRSWQVFWVGEAALIGRHSWHPATNVYEVEDGAVVRVEAAGLDRRDFKVVVQGDRLVIVGERRVLTPDAAVRCHRVEMASGRFRVDVPLPWPVDERAATVEYNVGIITVFAPRR